ncbi:hypothetical protein DFJ43DRAFT_1150221 [Lentinula guzmanii]|uniref:Uncharacterized protein n=1 Tax=Lentinula guzmanii TaxID=2804957 RepID=A0AA38JI31_9AGAR|nr:hypothetical protein DFJ43DRAFT_1150221 [Lentinula guzmanii]
MFDPHLQPPSPQLHSCRWGFTCTRSSPSGKELLQHVIVAHVRTAVPVFRNEIPILLRTTEGIGESYETEHFMSSLSQDERRVDSSQSQQLKNHSSSECSLFLSPCIVYAECFSKDSQDSRPTASLPSPPISSSSRPRGRDDEGNSLLAGSESPCSLAQDASPMSYEDLDSSDVEENPLLHLAQNPHPMSNEDLDLSDDEENPLLRLVRNASPMSNEDLDSSDDEENPMLAGSESPHSQIRVPSPILYEDSDPNSFNAQSSNVLLSDALQQPSPKFRTLDAASGSPRPGSIPPSPSFSDILASSTQKGPKQPQSHIPSRLLAHTLSSNSSSSSNSCAVVEAQLTPAEGDFSFDEGRDGPIEGLHVATATSDQSDLYRGQLHWIASQIPSTQHATQSELSQISLSVAPDHDNVNPRRTSSHVHSMPNHNSSLLVPPSSRLASSETPGPTRKQSWYAPTARPRKRSRDNNLSASVSPVDSPAISPRRASAFALSPGDGRLKIVRAPLNQATSRRISDDPSRSRKRYKIDSSADAIDLNPQPMKNQYPVASQRSRPDEDCDADVSQMQVETQLTMSPPAQRTSLFDVFNYPIQTQAPYDSQS